MVQYKTRTISLGPVVAFFNLGPVVVVPVVVVPVVVVPVVVVPVVVGRVVVDSFVYYIININLLIAMRESLALAQWTSKYSPK